MTNPATTAGGGRPEPGPEGAGTDRRRLTAVWGSPTGRALDPGSRRERELPPPTPGEAVGEAAGAAGALDRETGMRDLYARRHADMVRFAAFLCGDVHRADDIAHEAFVRVFGAWERIDDASRVDAYLKATVVNVVREQHRRTSVAERRSAPHLTLVASAEETAMGRVDRDDVLAAVAALPLRQRACVVMRHWMRMTESEIAATLQLSVGSVRTHIKRGTKALEKRLGDAR